MPYIEEKLKTKLDSDERDAQTAGELTYQLQQVLKKYLIAYGLKYQVLAECLGALEGAKIDLTERVIKPYEMRKARENGDVWPNHLTNAGTTPAAVSDNDAPRIRQIADPFPCNPQEA